MRRSKHIAIAAGIALLLAPSVADARTLVQILICGFVGKGPGSVAVIFPCDDPPPPPPPPRPRGNGPHR